MNQFEFSTKTRRTVMASNIGSSIQKKTVVDCMTRDSLSLITFCKFLKYCLMTQCESTTQISNKLFDYISDKKRI